MYMCVYRPILDQSSTWLSEGVHRKSNENAPFFSKQQLFNNFCKI